MTVGGNLFESSRSGNTFWVCAAVMVVSALVSAGFSLAALGGRGASDIFALYAASRSIALPIAAVSAVALRSRGGVKLLALAMALVQLFDAAIGFHIHNPFETYGPLFLAIAGFVAVARLKQIIP